MVLDRRFLGAQYFAHPINSAASGMNAQITNVEAILVDLPTIRAHQLAMATMQQQTLDIVRLRSSDGIEGIGEATTIGGLSYGEESPEGIKLTIDTYLAPAIIGHDATNINDAMLKLNKVARGNRFAKCAIETALLDAQGKRLGVPVSTLLGGAVRKTLPVLWTLASGGTQRDIEEAEMLLSERRHNTFKLKIGRRSVRDAVTLLNPSVHRNVLSLKLSDLLGVFQRRAHFVNAVNEVATYEFIDIEGEKLSVYHFHTTLDQVNFHGKTRI
jgi:muconate cycloisomerase